MVTAVSQGLTRAKQIYQERDKRVKELRSEGKKVMGYLCLYPVPEIMTALDLVPYRIFGDIRETITNADTYLATAVCPFLRSCLDLGLKGKYDFLDGVISARICDLGSGMGNYWNRYINIPYHYYIDTPQSVDEPAQRRHRELLKEFQRSLGSFTGKELSPERLKEAIQVHNQQRVLVRELYDLRKPDPPLIS
ncbi:2-hydroxyacyl-CoA dehydratase, partial [Chloroflexota bacterium]